MVSLMTMTITTLVNKAWCQQVIDQVRTYAASCSACIAVSEVSTPFSLAYLTAPLYRAHKHCKLCGASMRGCFLPSVLTMTGKYDVAAHLAAQPRRIMFDTFFRVSNAQLPATTHLTCKRRCAKEGCCSLRTVTLTSAVTGVLLSRRLGFKCS